MATKEKKPSIAMILDSISSGTFSWTVMFHARPRTLCAAPATKKATASAGVLTHVPRSSIGVP